MLPSGCTDWSAQLLRAARTVAAQLRPAATRTGAGQLPRQDRSPDRERGLALRVEADGRLLTDADRPVRLIAAWNADAADDSTDSTPGAAAPNAAAERIGGLMEIQVNAPSSADPLRVRAHRITVTGGPFTYEADDALSGPVQQRTWTVEPGAWRLTVPPAA